MCRHLPLATLLGSIVVVAATPAVAQSPDAPPSFLDGSSARLETTFTPGLWLPRILGDAALGTSSLARFVDIENELSLRDQEETFVGELELRPGDRFAMHFSGFDFSTGGSGVFERVADFGAVELRPGDAYRAELSFTSAAFELSYTPPRPWPGATWPRSETARFEISPLVALRLVDIDQHVERIGGARESVASDWLGVLAGARIDLRWRAPMLIDELYLHAAGAAGPALGGDGGAMAQVRAGVTAFVTPSLGLQFGYRLVHFDVEDGAYELDGGLQGVFFAVSARF